MVNCFFLPFNSIPYSLNSFLNGWGASFIDLRITRNKPKKMTCPNTWLWKYVVLSKWQQVMHYQSFKATDTHWLIPIYSLSFSTKIGYWSNAFILEILLKISWKLYLWDSLQRELWSLLLIPLGRWYVDTQLTLSL